MDSKVLRTVINQCPINTIAPPICEPISDVQTQDQTWCDGDTAVIDCGSQFIQIVCAFYGIDQAVSSCNILFYHPKCYFASSQDIVNSTCANTNSCVLTSFTTLFQNNPCYQLTNSLYIQWRCV